MTNYTWKKDYLNIGTSTGNFTVDSLTDQNKKIQYDNI